MLSKFSAHFECWQHQRYFGEKVYIVFGGYFPLFERTIQVKDAYQFFDKCTARECELSGTKMSDHIIFYGYDFHPFTSFFSLILVCSFEGLDFCFLK